jgi:hypothetical protein
MATPSAAARRIEARHPAKPKYRPSTPKPLGTDEFRTFLLRPGKPAIEISDDTVSVSWSDSGQILTGDLTEQDPDKTQKKVSVMLGDQIMLQGRTTPASAWAEVWRMRVETSALTMLTGTRAWTLADNLQNLADSVDDFRFVRGKAHKQGFLASEVARAVCRKYGIPVGSITRTKYRIKRQIAKNASPLDVITEAYRTERTQTGNRYVIRFKRGKLYITPLVRSSLLYEVGSTIADGTWSLAKSDKYATVLTVHGTPSAHKGKDAKGHTKRRTKKITTRVTRRKFTRRYGTVHKSVTMKGVDSLAEARNRGLALLAKRMTPTRSLTFTHPGILGIRRGQAIRLRDPNKGTLTVCWVTEVRHSVSAGDYSMDVTVTFTDPFKATAADKKAAARFKRAQAKNRKAAKSKHKTKTSKPTRRARARV